MAIPPQTSQGEPSSSSSLQGPPRYKLAHDLKGHSRSVTALRFSNDEKVLVSAGADGYLHFWEPTSGEHIRSLRAHRTGINDISISSDSLYIATASDDSTSTLHLLHPTTSTSTSSSASTPPTPIRLFASHTAPVLSIAFSPKSNLLVSGSLDESAIIWDVVRGKVLRQLPAHSEGIWTVGWDGEGGMVLTGSADGLIRLWDANTGQCLKTLDNDTNSPVSSATITPSSFFLLSSTLSSTIRIYNMHTSRVVKTLRAPGTYISESKPCPAIVFPAPPSSPPPNGIYEPLMNGQRKGKGKEAWVIAGSENGKVVIWDLSSRQVVQVLGEEGGGHGQAVLGLAVSADGKRVASGCMEPDNGIKIWRIEEE